MLVGNRCGFVPTRSTKAPYQGRTGVPTINKLPQNLRQGTGSIFQRWVCRTQQQQTSLLELLSLICGSILRNRGAFLHIACVSENFIFVELSILPPFVCCTEVLVCKVRERVLKEPSSPNFFLSKINPMDTG